MRKIRTMLVAVMMLTMANVANAQYMTYAVMRDHARFLTDRMAFTLRLSPDVIDIVYMINYDYIYGVNEYLDDIALGYNYDEYNDVLYHRDLALRRLLTASQWALYTSYDYFYRPIVFANNGWRFSIYAYDTRRTHFYYSMPRHYHEYRGGRYFHPIRAGRRPHVGHPAPGRPGPGGPAHDNRRNDRPHGGAVNPPRNNGGVHNGNRGGGAPINHHGDPNRGGVNNRPGGSGSGHNNPPQGNFNNRGNQGGGNQGGNRLNVGGSQNHGGNQGGGNRPSVGGGNRGGNMGGGQSRGGGSAPRTIRTSSGGSSAGGARPAGGRGGRH